MNGFFSRSDTAFDTAFVFRECSGFCQVDVWGLQARPMPAKATRSTTRLLQHPDRLAAGGRAQPAVARPGGGRPSAPRLALPPRRPGSRAVGQPAAVLSVGAAILQCPAGGGASGGSAAVELPRGARAGRAALVRPALPIDERRCRRRGAVGCCRCCGRCVLVMGAGDAVHLGCMCVSGSLRAWVQSGVGRRAWGRACFAVRRAVLTASGRHCDFGGFLAIFLAPPFFCEFPDVSTTLIIAVCLIYRERVPVAGAWCPRRLPVAGAWWWDAQLVLLTAAVRVRELKPSHAGALDDGDLPDRELGLPTGVGVDPRDGDVHVHTCTCSGRRS